ncbi:Histidine triad, conserved site [Lasallia pustulata]|uniref:Histidine triad, conserved site n=1 Tax=Lasallia pustulata TaxID=136370 RepID=A0A1W5D5J6_9LECA|nr:Histidine triad, conserved site [Lasallia pustulata]
MSQPTPPCPFCLIASSHPPFSPTSPPSTPKPPPSTYVLLSTPLVIAFLDIAPISRGHVLVATRAHREKVSDVTVAEGRALGAWLGVVSRAVVRSVGLSGKGGEGVGDWNIVQNNGARAAQVVPHVHFHIIPRPGDVPEIKNRSWTVFGKGQREELDEADAGELVGKMRRELTRQVERVREKEGEEAVKILLGDGADSGRSKL